MFLHSQSTGLSLRWETKERGSGCIHLFAKLIAEQDGKITSLLICVVVTVLNVLAHPIFDEIEIKCGNFTLFK